MPCVSTSLHDKDLTLKREDHLTSPHLNTASYQPVPGPHRSYPSIAIFSTLSFLRRSEPGRSIPVFLVAYIFFVYLFSATHYVAAVATTLCRFVSGHGCGSPILEFFLGRFLSFISFCRHTEVSLAFLCCFSRKRDHFQRHWSTWRSEIDCYGCALSL